MAALGTVLTILGVLWLGLAGATAHTAPNVSYLIGTFLPGLLCLIVGLKLRQPKKPDEPPSPGNDNF
jgi:hypothetical protein